MATRYRTGLPDELFGRSSRQAILGLPMGAGGAEAPSLVPPEQNQRDVLSRLASGLGITPEVPIPTEAEAGLGAGGGERVRSEEESIGRQGLMSILLLLSGLATGGVTAIPGAFMGGQASGRTVRLRNEVAGGEMRTARRQAEGRLASDERRKQELHPYEIDVLKSEAESRRALAQMRVSRDKVQAEAKTFENRINQLLAKRAKLREKGKDLSPAEMDTLRQTYTLYGQKVQQAFNFGTAMMSSMSSQGMIPGMGTMPSPTLPPFNEFIGDTGVGAPPPVPGQAPPVPFGGPAAGGSPPAGFTEMITMGDKVIWCRPGSEECWEP